MTTTTRESAPKAPAFTYRATVQEGTGMFASGAFGPTVKGVVIRSDGVTVWSGAAYSESGRARAQLQANQTVGRLRRYLAHHGACWHDRRKAAQAHTKAARTMQAQLRGELHEAASAGLKAAIDGAAEDSLPYAADTAQGIIATQAYRLAMDRLSDWAEENPEPVQP